MRRETVRLAASRLAPIHIHQSSLLSSASSPPVPHPCGPPHFCAGRFTGFRSLLRVEQGVPVAVPPPATHPVLYHASWQRSIRAAPRAAVPEIWGAFGPRAGQPRSTLLLSIQPHMTYTTTHDVLPTHPQSSCILFHIGLAIPPRAPLIVPRTAPPVPFHFSSEGQGRHFALP